MIRASLAMAFLLAGLSLILPGCGGGDPSPGRRSEAEAQERNQKAEALFKTAAREPPRRKIDLYRKLVGFYPESPWAAESHFLLVFYLLDQLKEDPGQAFEAAQIFGERFPTDLRVSEAWRLQDSEAGTLGHDELRARIQEAWSGWLAKARTLVTNADLTTRARVWYDSGDCLRRRHRFEEAVALLAEAAAWDLPEKDQQLATLVLLATVQGQDLGRKAEAIATWERALVLARANVRGETPERIEAAIAALQ